jgi:hypothetical protein
LELPQSRLIQIEKHLIQQNGLRFVAGGLEHEIGAVLAEQLSGLIDQVALLRQGSQVDGASRIGISM